MTQLDRRNFIGSSLAVSMLTACGAAPSNKAVDMYGLIGKFNAAPGKRDELIAILLESIGAGMPGCISYIVAQDPQDEHGVWITEVWDTKQSHQDSLSLPAVRDAITRAKPLIASFGQSFTTEPVGGIGLR